MCECRHSKKNKIDRIIMVTSRNNVRHERQVGGGERGGISKKKTQCMTNKMRWTIMMTLSHNRISLIPMGMIWQPVKASTRNVYSTMNCIETEFGGECGRKWYDRIECQLNHVCLCVRNIRNGIKFLFTLSLSHSLRCHFISLDFIRFDVTLIGYIRSACGVAQYASAKSWHSWN